MADFNWDCPHCERAVTISGDRSSTKSHVLDIDNSVGRYSLISTFVVCPNQECRKFALTAELFESQWLYGPCAKEILGNKLHHWNLIPQSVSKIFPDYVPKPIRDDYREACLIRDLSPKASATLSRRCLQGIVRDFWNVVPGNLIKEIEQIKDRVDPLTWNAIDAVRTLGNIGAHMEKDINLIVDVDPEEATMLIGLVETLIKEWYVARAEREARMNAVIAAASGKKAK